MMKGKSMAEEILDKNVNIVEVESLKSTAK